MDSSTCYACNKVLLGEPLLECDGLVDFGILCGSKFECDFFYIYILRLFVILCHYDLYKISSSLVNVSLKCNDGIQII